MKQNSGPLILAAAIVGGSVLAGSWMVRSSLDRTLEELETLRGQLATLNTGDAAAKPAKQERRRGPDPDRRYEVQTRGAPARGPLTAQVEIVEFSDFQ